jgi:glycosyltransferase involved in cell wall biosynthesis
LTYVYARWRFNVIHLQVALPHALWTLEWRRMLGLGKRIKVVVTTAGSDINVLPEIGYGELVDPANGPRARRVLSEADVLIPTSSNMASRMVELVPDVAGKIKIIPRGCSVRSLAHVRSRREAARARFGIPRDSFVVISVGRPARVKNYEFLLRVIAVAAVRIPELRLLSVGERNTELLDMAVELGIADRLIFTGRFPAKDADPNELLNLPHEGMVDAIAASDVGVLTSFIESYNNAAAEQGAAGLPLILTRNHGVRDRIPADFTRFVLDDLDETAFVDALDLLYRDRLLYNAYSRAVAASFAEVTHEWVAAEHIAVYRAALDGHL